MTLPRRTLPRRDFVRLAGSCAAHLALVTAGVGAGARELFGRTGGRRVAQEEPWGRLEEVADGVWALVSTPLEDRTTLCNGGIVAGRSGVVVVEAFASPEGAAWMARRARALTGRWPDQVVLTHYHGDHTGGCAGFTDGDGESAQLLATEATRSATDRTAGARGASSDDPLREALARVRILADEGAELDLGGRVLRLEHLRGHTESDVVARLDDPSVVFCGDLVWNGMFPNYVDARPTLLSTSVAHLAAAPAGTVFVPGHGPVADGADLSRYGAVLDHVEAVARAAHAEGLDAEKAAAGFVLPQELGEWMLFSPAYPERALGAWLSDLDETPG